MRVVKDVTELIGKTPIVKLNNIVDNNGANIYVKLESFNPGSSVKDRVALNMILRAEKEGHLKEGAVIVEPTSGNTGIGIAMIGAAKGYEVILVMPDTMSIERRKLLKAFGAKLVLTEGALGMNGAISKARELVRENENYYMPQQFENIGNPEAHSLTTALEIYEQMEGKVDALVSAVGTGGTVTGLGRTLKEKIKELNVVAVEPSASAVLSGEKPGPHKIQGIGAGFIPKILDMSVIDSIVKIGDEEAIEMARRVAKEEGLLVGISSGAAIAAAIKVAKDMKKEEKVVVIAPDYGERYLSTSLYEG
ncbi:cysteine synthase A [Anaeromicrobium sediminis]|uniref:Cysteine synthase n=1 Tax=Anaeromicrobium sediminis TaxID=1478221 RepID=A0A267MHD7_9FIRM|nr:cysteine synthase A [Anaeromicrobium sediminis]PAB58984.1 cysteine synthase A [Anaeromicrobium sediminis]